MINILISEIIELQKMARALDDEYADKNKGRQYLARSHSIVSKARSKLKKLDTVGSAVITNWSINTEEGNHYRIIYDGRFSQQDVKSITELRTFETVTHIEKIWVLNTGKLEKTQI